MPDLSFGLYPLGTEGDEVSSTYEGRHVSLYASEINHGTGVAVVTKGLPVIFGTVAGNHGVGIAFKTEVAGTDIIPIDTEGIWDVEVVGSDDEGGSLVTGGDPLFINTTTCVVSKIRDNTTQIPFGYALGQATGDGSALVISVKLHWDPQSHWLFEDEALYFGDTPDHWMVFTGEEVEFGGDRTTGGDGDYYRALHFSGDAALGAVDRWGTISTYTTLTGGAGGATSAFAGSFSLVQAADAQVTGFFGAVMAEIKNDADNCSTACALFCRWDNDSNVGFGGVMHSFIRFEDNSGGLNVQTLFELYGMDATTAASATEIVCQVGAANAASHVIKISANGVPYWIMMDSTPPA